MLKNRVSYAIIQIKIRKGKAFADIFSKFFKISAVFAGK